MDTLQERVNFLLTLRGITQAEATRRGGFKNAAFINDIVAGKKQNVRGENLLRLAAAFSTTADFLLGEDETPDLIDLGVGNPRNNKWTGTNLSAIKEARQNYVEEYDAPHLDPGEFPKEIPVRGIVVCGDDGDFMFNGQDVDYVRRGPGLISKRDIYALRVEGDSMWPAYKHGALVYVDPHRRPGVGEDAIIELHPDDPQSGEPGKGFLKRVKRVAGPSIIVEQFKPALDLTFARSDIAAFHRVIPWEEVMGI